MKTTDLRNKNPKELTQFAEDTKKRLAEIAIELRTKKVANIKEMGSLKKDLARALTIAHEQTAKEQKS